MPAGRSEASRFHRKSIQVFILSGKPADRGKTWTRARVGGVAGFESASGIARFPRAHRRGRCHELDHAGPFANWRRPITCGGRNRSTHVCYGRTAVVKSGGWSLAALWGAPFSVISGVATNITMSPRCCEWRIWVLVADRPNLDGGPPLRTIQVNNLNFLLRVGDDFTGTLQVSLTAWFGPGVATGI
jgi:hypothetical protein